jgi:uncharacterized RDD family membrane protein YckC
MAEPPNAARPSPVPAGFFRRAAATFADAFAGMLCAFLILSLLGLSIPMDSPQMGRYTRLLIFCAFFYVGLGPFFLPNTLGKYAFGVRVVSDRTGGKPTFLQYLLRGGMLFFWPLELVVLLFSRIQKRLGDRLAATSVVLETDAKRTWAKRIGLSIGVILLFYLILLQTMQMAAANTGMFQAAAAYLNRNRAGQERLGPPVRYETAPVLATLQQDRGHLIVGADGSRQKGYIEISLIRNSGRWTVEKWTVTKTPAARGFSYRH